MATTEDRATHSSTSTLVVPEPTPSTPVPEAREGRLEGTVLEGRYRIEHEIGSGGMSTVYLAEQLALRLPVAVKVLHYERRENLTENYRFIREAHLAARVVHPNVARVLDLGCTPDMRTFMVMDYLEGEDLATALERDGALPWPRARRAMRQMIRGLREAHEIGVLHRDIKPSNVFLVARRGRTEQVKLLDFGIAKASDPAAMFGEHLTGFGQVLGTIDYMPPERLLGEPGDVRSDIYSLGLVMFEMLTGQHPWPRGRGVAAALGKRVKEEPPSLPEFLPGVPQEMTAVVRRAMAREPSKRFATLRELEAALPTSTSSERPARGSEHEPADSTRRAAKPQNALMRWARTLKWRGPPTDSG
jgi:serine/threonine protein kinase